MTSVPDSTPALRLVPWTPLATAFGVGLVGAGGLLHFGLIPIASVLAVLAVLVAGTTLVGLYRRQSSLGWANGLTLARLVGVSWTAALSLTWLMTPPPSRTGVALLVVVVVVCLILDGLDGRVARVRGEVDEFGARFDMETDAALIMLLCIAVAAQGSVGWWVLVIGLARYGYWLCSLRVSALKLPVAPSLLRRTVAVGQSVAMLICLILGVSAIAPGWLPSAVTGIALTGLAWSFVSVTVHQLRAAHSSAGANPP